MNPLNDQPVEPDPPKQDARNQAPQNQNAVQPKLALTYSEPSDAVLDPLLARALAPDAPPFAPPVDLASTIFSRTRLQLASAAAKRKATLFGHSGLLGPIGLRRLHALAAGIVLASSVGILLVSSGILHDAYDTVTAKRQLASLSDYRGLQTNLDQEISQLALRIDAASASSSYTDSAAARTITALQTIISDQSVTSPVNSTNSDNLNPNDGDASLF